ncbi:hypothetical protein [Aquabacterium sp.]|uniref:VOC family protein n=1 Tax=Aquabacterium sp. TaxID=1872578 RepID=UPI00248A0F6D|nr:hypothetical protein [Aquabacterium sp.]MDI1261475.1 hypothetical protein [Aquabacterium sp.]
MSPQIFINLAVKDLDKTKAFFSSLGFSFNQQFTNEPAVDAMVAKAIAAEGTVFKEAKDHGFMHEHGVEDLHMDMSTAPAKF